MVGTWDATIVEQLAKNQLIELDFMLVVAHGGMGLVGGGFTHV